VIARTGPAEQSHCSLPGGRPGFPSSLSSRPARRLNGALGAGGAVAWTKPRWGESPGTLFRAARAISKGLGYYEIAGPLDLLPGKWDVVKSSQAIPQ
jgi:hypothetical protein